MIKFAKPSYAVPSLNNSVVDVARMREDRAARMRQVLREHGIPAILAANAGNVRYLTGYNAADVRRQMDYVLFFAEHDPVVWASCHRYQCYPELMPWIQNWRIAHVWLQQACGAAGAAMDAKLFAEEIRQELAERGLAKEKLGIACWDGLAQQSLKNAGLTIEDSWPLLLEAAKIKTQDEIACFREAASICTRGWQVMRDNLRPGNTTGAVQRIVKNAMLEAGAEVAGGSITSGRFSEYRVGGNRRLEPGDLLFASECGTSYMGHTSCLYRTFVVGRKPNQREQDMYKRLLERLNLIIDATRVGNTTADAAKFFPEPTSRGWKDEVESGVTEIGHGLGLPCDPPALVSYHMPIIQREFSLDYPQPFEAGMLMGIESLEPEHDYGAVRLENMVLITKDGPEIIDHWPRDEITVAGA